MGGDAATPSSLDSCPRTAPHPSTREAQGGDRGRGPRRSRAVPALWPALWRSMTRRNCEHSSPASLRTSSATRSTGSPRNDAPLRASVRCLETRCSDSTAPCAVRSRRAALPRSARRRRRCAWRSSYLPPADRALIVGYDWEGLSFAELGARHEISKSEARRRYLRSSRMLVERVRMLRDGRLDEALAERPHVDL